MFLEILYEQSMHSIELVMIQVPGILLDYLEQVNRKLNKLDLLCNGKLTELQT